MSAFNVVLVRPMIAEEANPPKPLEVRLPILVVDNAFRSALVKTETWVLVSACNLDELNPAIAVAFRPAMPSVASDAISSVVIIFNLAAVSPATAELLNSAVFVEPSPTKAEVFKLFKSAELKAPIVELPRLLIWLELIADMLLKASTCPINSPAKAFGDNACIPA